MRIYRVRAHGIVTDRQLAALADGVTIDEVRYGPVIVERNPEGKRAEPPVPLTLTEGKNREIRKLAQHLGLQVNRLIRVSYGVRRWVRWRAWSSRKSRGRGCSSCWCRHREEVDLGQGKPKPKKPGHRKLADKKRAAKDGRRMGVGRSPSSSRNSRTPRRGG